MGGARGGARNRQRLWETKVILIRLILCTKSPCAHRKETIATLLYDTMYCKSLLCDVVVT